MTSIIRNDQEIPWTAQQKTYDELLRKRPHEALKRFCRGVSSSPSSTNGGDSQVLSLDEETRKQITVLYSFFHRPSAKTDAYGSILHIVGRDFWEACLESELPFALVNVVARADFDVEEV